MVYIILSILTVLQLWCLLLLQKRFIEKDKAVQTPDEEEKAGPKAPGNGPEWAEEADVREADPYEQAFRDGVSSILNYDVAAARKAVQKDG